MPKTLTRKQELVKLYLGLFSPVKDDKGDIIRYAFSREALGLSGEGTEEQHEAKDKISNVLYRLNDEEHICIDDVYDQSYWALEWLDEAFDAEDEPDEDDLRDQLEERVDSAVNVYTHDLTAWLHRSVWHVYYITEALEEYPDTDDGFKLLQIAQYRCFDVIWGNILQLILEEFENIEE